MTSGNISELLAALQGLEKLLWQAVRERRIETFLVQNGSLLVKSIFLSVIDVTHLDQLENTDETGIQG